MRYNHISPNPNLFAQAEDLPVSNVTKYATLLRVQFLKPLYVLLIVMFSIIIWDHTFVN